MIKKECPGCSNAVSLHHDKRCSQCECPIETIKIANTREWEVPDPKKRIVGGDYNFLVAFILLGILAFRLFPFKDALAILCLFPIAFIVAPIGFLCAICPPFVFLLFLLIPAIWIFFKDMREENTVLFWGLLSWLTFSGTYLAIYMFYFIKK